MPCSVGGFQVAELVLVTGSSGIGKSSVVNELHKAIVASAGRIFSFRI